MFVCVSENMERLGSHWTDFHDILYLRIFDYFFKKIEGFINIVTE
jgi:hypothetical protein